MKDSWNMLAVKTIIFSAAGLCTLPFLSVIVQYIDSMTGFSAGRGYYADSMMYIVRNPLVYILVVLCVNILCAVMYLICSALKSKRENS